MTESVVNFNQTNLNPFNKEIRDGISLFVAVKNRKKTLTEALATWVTHKEIDEIIILDWDSDESLLPVIQKYQNGKIFLAEVKNQKKWILSLACNLAARLTSRSMILKMDGDVKIHKGFFEKHSLQPGLFYTGNWALGRDENETHLNGVAFFYRDDFFKVNGYNEFIKFYGWEDSDLYLRLEEKKLKRVDFTLDTLHHIEHGDRILFQDKPGHFRNISDKEREDLNIIINRQFSQFSEPWSAEKPMLMFDVSASGAHTMSCVQSGKDGHIIPVDIVEKSEVAAVKERLRAIDPAHYEKLCDFLSRVEIIELYNLFFIPESDHHAQTHFSLIQKIKGFYRDLVRKNEDEISRLSAELSSLEKSLGESQQQNTLREQMISGLNDELARKENTLRETEQIIQEKEQIICDLDQQILKQSESLMNYEKLVIQLQISNQESKNTITSQKQEILIRDQQIATLNDHLSTQQKMLRDVYSSYSWKFGHFIFSLLGKLMFWTKR